MGSLCIVHSWLMPSLFCVLNADLLVQSHALEVANWPFLPMCNPSICSLIETRSVKRAMLAVEVTLLTQIGAHLACLILTVWAGCTSVLLSAGPSCKQAALASLPPQANWSRSTRTVHVFCLVQFWSAEPANLVRQGQVDLTYSTPLIIWL